MLDEDVDEPPGAPIGWRGPHWLGGKPDRVGLDDPDRHPVSRRRDDSLLEAAGSGGFTERVGGGEHPLRDP